MNVPKLRFKEFDGEWEEKKIGGFFDHLSTGSTPSRTNPDYFKGEIPWISSGELKSHYISDTKEHVSELAVKETNLKIHPPGTFFIAITGLEAKGTRSSAAINTVPMTTNQSCLAFKPNDLIDLNFLYFWYKKNGERIGITYTQGTKQQSLTPGLVRDLDITVPKIEEQKYISRFFNIVEKKIQLQQQKIDLLQEQKKGFLQKMFPKAGETQPEMRFDGFTGEWKTYKLGEIVDFYSGLTYSPDDVLEKEGTFVLRSSNIKGGNIVNADNVYVNSLMVNSEKIKKGDIIVVVRNGSRNLIGKHAIVKKEISNTVIGAFMTGIRTEIPDFINALLDTEKFNIEISKNLGATINQITTGSFKKMNFSIPAEEEQSKIGRFFRAIDDSLEIEHQKLKLLKKQKQGFMQQMFI